MSFSPVKSIFLLFCGVTFLGDLAYARIALNDDGIVGVSQKKLNDYITKAIKGFRNVVLRGDEDLNYPIMDPYELEDVSFDYVDRSGGKKYRLNFINTNSTLIKGLSNYEVNDVGVSAKDMQFGTTIEFNEIRTKFPYKLEGYTLKNYLPLYGEGFVELSTKNQKLELAVDLSIDRGFIVVEEVQSYRYYNDIDVKVTGLMDLSDPFASILVDDILDQWIKEHGSKVLNDYVRDVVEDAIGGMTVEEFFEYLDYLVQKYDQQ